MGGGSWLKQVACFPLQRAELDSGPVHVAFILDEGAIGKYHLRDILFALSVSFDECSVLVFYTANTETV